MTPPLLLEKDPTVKPAPRMGPTYRPVTVVHNLKYWKKSHQTRRWHPLINTVFLAIWNSDSENLN